ncbi:hypothetical protein [Spirosoma liriopis]|nr:hypothetical protein [Spirosoma liriopis]
MVNRRKAYFGSIMHFGRALFTRQLTQQGFVIQKVIERKNSRGDVRLIGLPGDSLLEIYSLTNPKKIRALPMASYKVILDTVRSTALEPIVYFTDLIQVTYTKEQEPYAFQRARRSASTANGSGFQYSLLRTLEASVTVDATGQFWRPHGIRSEGYLLDLGINSG